MRKKNATIAEPKKATPSAKVKSEKTVPLVKAKPGKTAASVKARPEKPAQLVKAKPEPSAPPVKVKSEKSPSLLKDKPEKTAASVKAKSEQHPPSVKAKPEPPAQPAKTSPEKKRLTGRFLVRLDPKVPIKIIEQKIKARSLNFIYSKDHDGGLAKALESADGIIFEKLRVVLVREPSIPSVKRMMALRNSPFLAGEPERYLYKQADDGAKSGSGSKPDPDAKPGSGAGSRSGSSGNRPGSGAKPSLPFRNTVAATWGIQAVNARKSAFTGKNIKLAILDTGFDFTHPDFAGRVIHRKSFVGRQAKDREGHGTHCVGIAGGSRKGKAGARYGVASEARLYVGKILDDAGEGSDGSALAGIEWALEKGCQVISMSFGASVGARDPYSEIFEDVAQIAMANNCILIAATGNESDRAGGKIAPVNHPANCPSVIAVAALTESLKIADYSCAGRQVNISAPGDNIVSAAIGGGYDEQSGTSMATPFVAGIAALLWEQHPQASALEIRELLLKQAERIKASMTDAGAGLVYAR